MRQRPKYGNGKYGNRGEKSAFENQPIFLFAKKGLKLFDMKHLVVSVYISEQMYKAQ